MNPNAEKWVEELESGKYSQTTGVLHDDDDNYCCLGVACKIAEEAGIVHSSYVDELMGRRVVRYDGSAVTLPFAVMKWLGLRGPSGAFKGHGDDDSSPDASLANMNDEGATFQEIAATIRERWSDLAEEES